MLFYVLAILAPFAWFATAYVGWKKGSSFWIWFLVGAVLPYFGLIAALLYRREQDEPEANCPTCGKVLKLYVQVCPRCGTDLFRADPAALAD
jgi:fatty acid desaturase